MSILFLLLLLLLGVAVLAALIYAALHGSRGPRYQGEAPHKGKVMRFTGTSSEIMEDSGDQRTTKV